MGARKLLHILKLSAKQQREFVNSFDVVLCDCDGVMWLISAPLPRTGEAVNALKADGKQVLFVSNNSVRSDEDYRKKFVGIGVKNFRINDIMHPVKAMLYYLKKHNIKQPVFSLCSSFGNDKLRNAGIDVRTLVANEAVTPATLERITKPEQKMGAVLYDINLELTYAQLVAATRYLADKDCQFIAGGLDRTLPMTREIMMPGFCDFLDTISSFTRREPTIVSKPALLLGEILKDVYRLTEPSRCLFIGDSLKNDVGFGRDCGFQTLLVLSGTTCIEEMWQASAKERPHYYADRIADFIELYANINKKC
ncbi:uncharacterized protein LOC109579472 [Bactrocera dorsalis]|uniref:Uncharacterized protein LOC109579472 n=1 Tax=Bactrocera dorsalis TaxID=27457 RepID=A0A6J0RGK0_BACDO|nr:uncharacterized protein LOC109579472 [Bactrocera dorsalis]